MKRKLGIALGGLCVLLGVVGIVVPGLPTTCFLLAASWIFTRTSPRLRARLQASRWLGGYLRAAEGRTMPMRARLVSIAAIWLGTAFALRTATAGSPVLSAALAIAAVTGTAAVLLVGRRRRDPRPAPSPSFASGAGHPAGPASPAAAGYRSSTIFLVSTALPTVSR